MLDVKPGWQYDITHEGRAYQRTQAGNSTSNLTLAVGMTYNFPPVDGVTFASGAGAGLENVSFALLGGPPGFLMDASNGFVQGSANAAGGPFLMRLVAIDNGGRQSAALATYRITLKQRDAADTSNGPNSRGCGNPKFEEDLVEFDGQFTCNCANDDSYDGANCGVVVATASDVATSSGDGSTVSAAIGAVFGAFVLGSVAVLLVTRRRAHRLKMKAFDFKEEIQRMKEAGELQGQLQLETLQVPREIKRVCISLVAKIGSGQFGEVWKATCDESSSGGVPSYLVAVKTSKDTVGEGATELLQEAAVMALVPAHPNLVSLVGVVTRGVPLLLVVSFCENGSLLSYLKDTAVSLGNKLRMASEIACGMAHLVQNHVVHRDLAARNVLVDSAAHCLIADFGLSRGLSSEKDYYKSSSGQFPIRWTAPEAMSSGRFNEASDVWSFGITLVELFNDGARPYPGMGNAEVMTKVQAGHRHPKPRVCPDRVYSIVAQCWEPAAADRPSFDELAALLPMEQDGEDLAAGATDNEQPDGAMQQTTGYVPGNMLVETAFGEPDAAAHEYLVPSVNKTQHSMETAFGEPESANEYLVPSVNKTQRSGQREHGTPADDEPDGDGYMMPSDDNMRRISSKAQRSGQREHGTPADDEPDGDGYMMPSDDNMRRISTSFAGRTAENESTGSALTAAVVFTNPAFDGNDLAGFAGQPDRAHPDWGRAEAQASLTQHADVDTSAHGDDGHLAVEFESDEFDLDL